MGTERESSRRDGTRRLDARKTHGLDYSVARVRWDWVCLGESRDDENVRVDEARYTLLASCVFVVALLGSLMLFDVGR